MDKQIEEVLDRNAKLQNALESMCFQFAGWDDKYGGYTTMGLSALEEAFNVLGWNDPHVYLAATCQWPNCKKQRTSGIPTSNGYMLVCGEHFRALDLKENPNGKECV
jgi:hypothetical protein